MEYLSSLAPKGQQGLFMGYVNIPVAIGWMAGSKIAGNLYETTGDKVNLARKHLIDVLGMDSTSVSAIPKSEVMTTLAGKMHMSVAEAQNFLFTTYQPYKVWWVIAGMGVLSLICMLIYDRVIRHLDAKKEAATETEKQSYGKMDSLKHQKTTSGPSFLNSSSKKPSSIEDRPPLQ